MFMPICVCTVDYSEFDSRKVSITESDSGNLYAILVVF